MAPNSGPSSSVFQKPTTKPKVKKLRRRRVRRSRAAVNKGVDAVVERRKAFLARRGRRIASKRNVTRVVLPSGSGRELSVKATCSKFRNLVRNVRKKSGKRFKKTVKTVQPAKKWATVKSPPVRRS